MLIWFCTRPFPIHCAFFFGSRYFVIWHSHSPFPFKRTPQFFSPVPHALSPFSPVGNRFPKETFCPCLSAFLAADYRYVLRTLHRHAVLFARQSIISGQPPLVPDFAGDKRLNFNQLPNLVLYTENEPSLIRDPTSTNSVIICRASTLEPTCSFFSSQCF